MKYYTTTQIRIMLGYESQQTVTRRARACGIVPDMVGSAYCYNEEQVQQIRDYRFPARKSPKPRHEPKRVAVKRLALVEVDESVYEEKTINGARYLRRKDATVFDWSASV